MTTSEVNRRRKAGPDGTLSAEQTNRTLGGAEETLPPFGRLPELLAPAGSPDALEAAIEGGADAVYLGATGFNARKAARNFDSYALREAVSTAHAYGVKVYLTLNTLVYDRELTEYLSAAAEAYTAGVDALIVADAGGAALLRRTFPDFELHASTQMSGHNTEMATRLRALGFSRMVAARELPFDDLAVLCRNAPLEIEMFVHGALCVCHSGQCLFSSAVGGRSGNRGECAQPCRLPYGGKDRYPLSLKDLSLAGHIPELLRLGVASLKIEGRMKSPAYVYGVTRIWRRLLDERRSASPEEMRELSDLFSRGGFTDGYFTRRIGSGMLGTRTDADKRTTREAMPFPGLVRKVPLDLTLTARAGQPLRLCAAAVTRSEEVGFEEVSRTSGAAYSGGASGTKEATCPSNGRRAETSGNPDAARTVTVTGPVPEVAVSLATTEEAILPKLTRLGGTPYQARRVRIDMDQGLLIPFSVINTLRREAVRLLTDAARPLPATALSPDLLPPADLYAADGDRARGCHSETRAELTEPPCPTSTDSSPASADSSAALTGTSANLDGTPVAVPREPCLSEAPANSAVFFSPEQITPTARAYFDRIYLPSEIFDGTATAPALFAGCPADGVFLPPVIFDSERGTVLGQLRRARAAGVRYAMIDNAGHLDLARDAGLIPVGGFRLNITNAHSVAAYRQAGLEAFLLSPELSLPRLRDLCRAPDVSAIVYGRIPLMVTEKCVGKELGGCEVCQRGQTVLTDRIGARFPVRRIFPHRSVIFNSVPTYMADRRDLLVRYGITKRVFLFTVESPRETDAVIEAYKKGTPPGGSVRRIPQ